MEPQKYDVMRFVKENDEKLQRHYEKMKELEQRERELNFQQMYRKYTSNRPEDYKSSNTFPQTDTYTQNEQPQYQIVTEPQRNNNNQYVYEMNTYKNGMFNPLAPSSSFDNRNNQVLQSSNAKSNFSNSQNQSQSYGNAHGTNTNMTGNFAYSNNHSGGNVNNDNDDFNYRNMKEEMLKRNNGEGAQQYSQGGTGSSAVFQYGYNSNNSENKNQYHFSIENNNNGNNRSEGEEEGDGDEQEGEDFKYKGIEELRKEIMKNSQNVNNNNVNSGNQQQKQAVKQQRGVNNEVNNNQLQQEENLYEESKYRSDEDDVNKIIQQQNQQQQGYQFANNNNNNNNNINNNEGRSSDDDDETYPKNIPKQNPQLHPKQQLKPKAPTHPSKPSTQKPKQYTEDKHIQPPQYHPYTNPQYQYQDSNSQDHEHDILPLPKKPVKRFNKKYNGKIDSVALLNHYESLWKRKSKAKKKPKSSSKLPTRPPFNSNPSPLPTSTNDDNPLITRESKLKMHKLQFITAPLRYYYKV